MELVRRAIFHRDEPTVVQITFSGQKHTWLSWPWAVTLPDINGVFILTDIAEKPVFIAVSSAQEMIEDVRKLAELGIPKSEVMEAKFSGKTYTRLLKNNAWEYLSQIEEKYHARLDWKLATAIFWHAHRASGDDRSSRRLEEAQVEKSS